MQNSYATHCISAVATEILTFTVHPHQPARSLTAAGDRWLPRPCPQRTIKPARRSLRHRFSSAHKYCRSKLSPPVIRAVAERCLQNAKRAGNRRPVQSSGTEQSGLQRLLAGVPGVLHPRQRHDEQRGQEQAEQGVDPDERDVEGAHSDASDESSEGSAEVRFHGLVRSKRVRKTMRATLACIS